MLWNSLMLWVALYRRIRELPLGLWARPKPVVGAENLCHQVILVNQSSGAVAPEDPEVIQVRDAIGQRSQRRGKPA